MITTAMTAIAVAMALTRCAAPTLDPAAIRGDSTFPRSQTFFVREFEEGNDWLSANGQPAGRPEILAHLNSLTTKIRDRLERLGPTRVLMTSIPKEGLLITGQIIRVREGPNPAVEGRVLIYDLARSYHYPVTIFDFQPSEQARARTLDEFWDLVARTTAEFVRERMRP